MGHSFLLWRIGHFSCIINNASKNSSQKDSYLSISQKNLSVKILATRTFTLVEVLFNNT